MKENTVGTKELFSIEHTMARASFEKLEYPWEILPDLKRIIGEIGKNLPADIYDKRGDGIWIAKSAKVADNAYIGAPCIIGERSEIRHCAFIRSSALIGDDCVVGNSTELKNCILFDGVQVPHYNYVGDSILGYKAHMGAGAITSNVKSDRSSVKIKFSDGEVYDIGLRKVGAMIGDYVEIGCNCVLNPGTVICKNSNVYPLSSVRGVVLPDSIYKNADNVVFKR